jgi:hypothetical protein
MQSEIRASGESKASIWAGRIISGLIVAFMLFDGIVKVMKAAPAVEGTVKLGYPVNVIQPLGFVVLACVALYAIPRTSVLGAILLTGFLGGATATQVRVQDPWFLAPVVVGVLAWTGLYLRDSKLRTLIPVRGVWQ